LADSFLIVKVDPLNIKKLFAIAGCGGAKTPTLVGIIINALHFYYVNKIKGLRGMSPCNAGRSRFNGKTGSIAYYSQDRKNFYMNIIFS
jgi:hypothetical protein